LAVDSGRRIKPLSVLVRRTGARVAASDYEGSNGVFTSNAIRLSAGGRLRRTEIPVDTVELARYWIGKS
jgi:hypothetical protein